ncbi:metallophosphatase [bacterium (Candidatus Blackallbacteria) CG17_big_fil_post_rev_8_21_14_2_50_48_46]|uniref:Metallophosphatase n=1 Tax=bacterium (Candidatus Blackallbacteria) CG17_big_fil_post_rev_8_21_14_2_50_48_46 TaxID=2014261 RepID=A0A2M7G0U8_9BACT|nr:MAG: metallophosphatase [bacterium (Candidatus Blackallbacteria) CG18_big_fil_WC_8_21_14_2_50_49_26]PIW15243.1 MAG: metallophosphatase [bacterium (Candidatus Blackallbacteria) CG17_big_fil_post_rev_8_21_14_2_50_48_46]PIW45248.1 MAG: metallophosphatase [bacterium (Candidatus Blackallbacteria) CG13_big_fil_rev_8_21_14_2_50_49_14]
MSENRTLVIGDIHGCARELQKLLENVQPTRVILVGDLFTKGPDPSGVWELIQQYRMQAVLGNHDAWLLKIRDGEVEPRPKHERIVDCLDQRAPGWESWLRKLPLFLDLDPFIVVHAGLHPSGEVEKTTSEMALLMRHWPMGNLSAPHWHEVYTGQRGVIFGHDARQGLVYIRRNNQPFLIGLDTGCVYGKKLTGYLLEKDELFQVSAAQVYQPIYC